MSEFGDFLGDVGGGFDGFENDFGVGGDEANNNAISGTGQFFDELAGSYGLRAADHLNQLGISYDTDHYGQLELEYDTDSSDDEPSAVGGGGLSSAAKELAEHKDDLRKAAKLLKFSPQSFLVDYAAGKALDAALPEIKERLANLFDRSQPPDKDWFR